MARQVIRRTLDHALMAAWLAVVLAVAAQTAVGLRWRFDSPGWTTMWESAPLEVAAQVARGGPVYGDLRTGPVRLAIYGPAWYGLVGGLSRLAGMDPERMIAVGRLTGIVSLCVAVGAVPLILRRAGAGPAAAAAGLGCIALLTPTGLRFAASSRPDAPAAALSALGLWLAFAPGRRRPLLGAVLLAGAMQMKITSVAAVVAVGLGCAAVRDWRRLGMVAGGAVLLGGAVLGVAAAWSGGRLLEHLAVASDAPFAWGYVRYMLLREPREVQVLLLLALPTAALLSLRTSLMPAPPVPESPGDAAGRLRRACASAIPAWYMAAVLVALVTAARQGSDRNYLIEPAMAAGPVLGLWVRRAATIRPTGAWWSTRIAAAAVTACAGLLCATGPGTRYDADAAAIARLLTPYQPQAWSWARGLPQPLLSLDPWLTFRAGVENDLNDPLAWASRCLNRDDDVIARRAAAGSYAAIVVTGPLEAAAGRVYGDIPGVWPALARAVADRYRPAGAMGPWQVYVPADGPLASGGVDAQLRTGQ